MDSCRLSKQRDRDVQQVRVIKGRDALAGARSVTGR